LAQNTLEIMTTIRRRSRSAEERHLSAIASPEHAELHLLLSMVTPLGWLERVPTYKEALANVKDKDLHTYGFLGYPVCKRGHRDLQQEKAQR